LLTKQKITTAPLPTVHDIKAKRLEITRADIRETIAAGGLDKYRVVVETLAEEFDVMDIAAAAVQLAHQAEAGEEPTEIPPAPEPRTREKAVKSEKYGKHGEKSDRPAKKPASRGAKMVRVFIGSGKTANMRPADLVGAIANEAGIEAKSIGAIEISEKFSLVELPEELVDDVIKALRSTTIKGKKQTVRRDVANRA
jgi:ATP-dependent RNA helicase DeaD